MSLAAAPPQPAVRRLADAWSWAMMGAAGLFCAVIAASLLIHDRGDQREVGVVRAFRTARIDIAPPQGSPDLASLKIIAVDSDFIEMETVRIKRRFNEIFQ